MASTGAPEHKDTLSDSSLSFNSIESGNGNQLKFNDQKRLEKIQESFASLRDKIVLVNQALKHSNDAKARLVEERLRLRNRVKVSRNSVPGGFDSNDEEESFHHMIETVNKRNGDVFKSYATLSQLNDEAKHVVAAEKKSRENLLDTKQSVRLVCLEARNLQPTNCKSHDRCEHVVP